MVMGKNISDYFIQTSGSISSLPGGNHGSLMGAESLGSVHLTKSLDWLIFKLIFKKSDRKIL